MNGKLKTVLLICSLIFNITIVSMMIYRSISTPKYPEIRRERPHTENFDVKRREIGELRRLFIESRRELFNELRSEQPDVLELQSLLETVIKRQIKMEEAIGNNLIELRMSMTPEEAQEFFDKMIERRRETRRKR